MRSANMNMKQLFQLKIYLSVVQIIPSIIQLSTKFRMNKREHPIMDIREDSMAIASDVTDMVTKPSTVEFVFQPRYVKVRMQLIFSALIVIIMVTLLEIAGCREV